MWRDWLWLMTGTRIVDRYNSINVGPTSSGWSTAMACPSIEFKEFFTFLNVYVLGWPAEWQIPIRLSSGRNPRMSACDPRKQFLCHPYFVEEFRTETIKYQLQPRWVVKVWVRSQDLTITLYFKRNVNCNMRKQKPWNLLRMNDATGRKSSKDNTLIS
jgi:hypothetical protein